MRVFIFPRSRFYPRKTSSGTQRPERVVVGHGLTLGRRKDHPPGLCIEFKSHTVDRALSDDERVEHPGEHVGVGVEGEAPHAHDARGDPLRYEGAAPIHGSEASGDYPPHPQPAVHPERRREVHEVLLRPRVEDSRHPYGPAPPRHLDLFPHDHPSTSQNDSGAKVFKMPEPGTMGATMGERPEFRCLRCGHTVAGYKAEVRERRCPRPECRSYSVVEADLFDAVVADVLRAFRRRGWPFPLLNLCRSILRRRGVRLRPLQTLEFAIAVEEEVCKRTARTKPRT